MRSGMESLEKAFLDGIIADSDDLAPRLIFADWLEEHDVGENGYADRAEFIRAQCRLAEAAPDDPYRIDWTIKEQALLDRHRTEWERPLAQLGVRSVEFREGFPYRVTMTATDFLKHAPRLFAAAPLVRSARIILKQERMRDRDNSSTLRELALPASIPVPRTANGPRPER